MKIGKDKYEDNEQRLELEGKNIISFDVRRINVINGKPSFYVMVFYQEYWFKHF